MIHNANTSVKHASNTMSLGYARMSMTMVIMNEFDLAGGKAARRAEINNMIINGEFDDLYYACAGDDNEFMIMINNKIVDMEDDGAFCETIRY
jgi:hypothetical protein